MLGLGFVPVLLTLIFLLQPGNVRLRLGWFLFFAAIAVVALQTTGFYYLLYKVPTFNLFRSYLLVFLFGVFALLVMSAYGFDALLSAEPAERRRLLRRALMVLAAMTAVAWLIAFGLLHLHRPPTPAVAPSFALSLGTRCRAGSYLLSHSVLCRRMAARCRLSADRPLGRVAGHLPTPKLQGARYPPAAGFHQSRHHDGNAALAAGCRASAGLQPLC